MDVSRHNIWRNALTFYNVNMEDLTKVRQPFRTTFICENGNDVGTLKVEFFSKVFEVARKELLENIDEMPWYTVPTRSRGNLQIFKIFVIIIAHSLLQQDPYFSFFTPWVVEVLLNENGVSKDISLNHVPLTSGTGNPIKFIKLLNQCDIVGRISDLFNNADSPASEQISSSSEWDPSEHITSKNKDILVNMLLYQETIGRRGRGVDANREDLNVMGFAKHFRYPATESIFSGISEKPTAIKTISRVEWKKSGDKLVINVLQWFWLYIGELDAEIPKKIGSFVQLSMSHLRLTINIFH